MEYKGYMIEALGTFPMVKVKAKGQGKVPQAISGLYTTREIAMNAIDGYLSSLVKGKRNGKAKGSSTD